MKRTLRRVLAALVLGCTAINANAMLVNSDWLATGDQLITVDTNSGLQWLNFSQTAIGHQAIRNELTTTYDGFRFANASELQGLFANYVPALPANGFMFGNDATSAAHLQFVMDSLGYDDSIYYFVNTCEYATGCDALGSGAGNGIRRHILSANVATNDFGIWFNDDNDFAQIQALVRVPEPGTLSLALLAGFMLIALNRNHRRNPAPRRE